MKFFPVLLLLLLSYAEARWTPVASGEGGHILLLYADTGQVMAMGPIGVFRSADHGDNWTPVHHGMRKYYQVTALGASGQALLAGYGDGAISRSMDGGVTWDSVSAGIPGSIRQFQRTDGFVLAATSQGLFRSGDDGATWNPTGDPVSFLDITQLVYNGSNAFAASRMGGGYRSTDQGLTWTRLTSVPAGTRIVAIGVHGPYLLAGTNEGIFRSSDQGETWTLVFIMPWPYATRNPFASLGAWIYFNTVDGTHPGVFRSADAGETWTDANPSLPRLASPALVSDGSHLYSGGSYGIWRSTDTHQAWHPANRGIDGTRISSLAISGEVLLWSGQGRSGVQRSTDNGETFENVGNGLPNTTIPGADQASGRTSVFSLLEHEGEVLAGGQQGGFRSLDQGHSWTVIPSASGIPVHALAASGNNYFAFATAGNFRGYRIYASGDRGASWIRASPALDKYSPPPLAALGTALFLGSNCKGVTRSTDGGETWVAANNGLPSFTQGACTMPGSFARLDGDLYVVAKTGGQEVGSLHRSSDQGEHWIPVPVPLASIQVIKASGGRLLIGGSAGEGVHVSSDRGATWTPAGPPLPPGLVVDHLAENSTHIFAGAYYPGGWTGDYYAAGQGVWRLAK